MRHKNLIFSLIFMLISSLSWAQNPENEVKIADSLFLNKKYTQSLKVYQNVFDKGKYTPAMLLKMAYIYEGLEDYPRTIFFLSKLHKISPSESLEEKIQTLAVNHNLQGYGYNDTETLKEFYLLMKKYLSPFLTIYMLVIMLLFIFQKNTKLYPILFLFGCFLWSILQLIPVNNLAAVVWQENTYAMDTASSAGKVIDMPKKGHRYLVSDKGDIWIRLQDGDQELFIKKSQLKFI